MSGPTVAEQLIDVLRRAGNERVYGVVGDSLNPVVDAIRRTSPTGSSGCMCATRRRGPSRLRRRRS